ncbi:hypothetical protein [Paenibacillus sp. UNC499MF]|uniref:hypothetical protein n=1 Tax=Paenibacillus sp. UNC499MF TaxID=1502751 RepID=UPI00089FC936|nr:hypothetical protein [Paenibacillus sp. UNC499MF]SEG15211.1 hypothetical protein SAMN02799616_02051 [Paenibacillus sp. UNC499MF]
MQHGDTLILILLLGLLAAWAGISFRKWLYEPYTDSFQPVRMTDYNEVPEDDEVVELLIGAGFDVVGGKTKIPISMTLNQKDELYSRLFIDYFAEKEDNLYLVKVARERRPLEMTGSAIRDMLLVYSLLVPEAAGVLYVDMNGRKIKQITFTIEVFE